MYVQIFVSCWNALKQSVFDNKEERRKEKLAKQFYESRQRNKYHHSSNRSRRYKSNNNNNNYSSNNHRSFLVQVPVLELVAMREIFVAWKDTTRKNIHKEVGDLYTIFYYSICDSTSSCCCCSSGSSSIVVVVLLVIVVIIVVVISFTALFTFPINNKYDIASNNT